MLGISYFVRMRRIRFNFQRGDRRRMTHEKVDIVSSCRENSRDPITERPKSFTLPWKVALTRLEIAHGIFFGDSIREKIEEFHDYVGSDSEEENNDTFTMEEYFAICEILVFLDGRRDLLDTFTLSQECGEMQLWWADRKVRCMDRDFL